MSRFDYLPEKSNGLQMDDFTDNDTRVAVNLLSPKNMLQKGNLSSGQVWAMCLHLTDVEVINHPEFYLTVSDVFALFGFIYREMSLSINAYGFDMVSKVLGQKLIERRQQKEKEKLENE